ncbi:unnamed protein product [Schistosoma curassoni]|uniref:40S ribosomal protein S7 n=1 Tax=Schistosoma curassoni TaxID=6186 RepID=A0A183KB99_9TREM|nr:unnamed protein product [Schistosoma curassoni]
MGSNSFCCESQTSLLGLASKNVSTNTARSIIILDLNSITPSEYVPHSRQLANRGHLTGKCCKKCFSKRGQNASNRTRSVDTQIVVKQTQVISKTGDSHRPKEGKQCSKRSVLTKNSRNEVSSVLRLLNGIQQETPRSRDRKARSVSSGKNNLTSQIVDNRPESHSMFDATVVASPSSVDEWVQLVRKKQRSDIKRNPAPVKVVEKSKADHSDRSVIFHRIKESESSETKARLEHDIVLIKQLLNQLMPQNITVVTLLKVYRLSSLANLKPNQSRLLKVVFKSSNERDLILQNGHKLKDSGVFIRKDLPLADRVKRRGAKKRAIT